MRGRTQLPKRVGSAPRDHDIGQDKEQAEEHEQTPEHNALHCPENVSDSGVGPLDRVADALEYVCWGTRSRRQQVRVLPRLGFQAPPLLIAHSHESPPRGNFIPRNQSEAQAGYGICPPEKLRPLIRR
jgi:hypothetical protein